MNRKTVCFVVAIVLFVFAACGFHKWDFEMGWGGMIALTLGIAL